MAVEETNTTAEPAVGTGAEGAVSMSVVRYPVAPGHRVNVRSGPGTKYGIVRTLPLGASVPIYCQTRGESVSGPYGTSNIWDNIASDEFVADAYVKTGSDGYVAPRCG
ncbi:SH3 domain-containing protein [Streptomyces bikiniensis]|uniref:SH3 domain-containing protein n=1 Tax=Streptomyces bikiniensis TaxID=1896 RepID=UPI0004BF9C6E|nr:SH3 domain-containing protein [Streptomyces bikiniensis]